MKSDFQPETTTLIFALGPCFQENTNNIKNARKVISDKSFRNRIRDFTEVFWPAFTKFRRYHDFAKIQLLSINSAWQNPETPLT